MASPSNPLLPCPPPPPPPPSMDTPRSRNRTVLEPCTTFDPATLAGVSPAAPLTIRSLALHTPSDSQTLIYIGTGGGKILLLSSRPFSTPANPDFLRSVFVTTRPIASISVLPEIGRILALSDGSLFLLDLLLLHPPRKLNFGKDVTAIAKRLSCSDSSPPIDLVSKDEILRPGQRLLSKMGGGIRVNGTGSRSVELQREGGSSSFVAVAAGKILLVIELLLPGASDKDSDAGGVSILLKEIQGIEGVKTMEWIEDSIIVGTLDGYTRFSVSTGKSELIFSLPEGSILPKLKSLRKSKEVLLLVDNVGVVLNALGQPVGGSLVFPYVPESIAEMASYIAAAGDDRLDLYRMKTGVCVQSLVFAKNGIGPSIMANDDQGSGEILVVATPYKGMCYCKVPAEEQIKYLLRKKNIKEAICLVEEFDSEGEMTKEMFSFVHAQMGFLLLFDLHFEDAVNHFLLSEDMQPSEIFPFIMRDPNRWSHLVPRNRYWGLHSPPVPLEEVVDNGLMTIQRAIYLKKAGVDTASDEDFLSNPPSRSDLLESAIENFIRYLRVSREKNLDPLIMEGVDTLLMYLLRALNHVDDMEKLASSQNSCIVEELETLLDDSGHLRTLAFLYASKGIYSKALAIWRILARNYSTGLWKDPATSVEYKALGNSTEIISGQKTAAIEASKLLQESSDQDLVVEHLGWIADIDQELSVIVLTSDKRTGQLSPEGVLAAIDPNSIEIHQRYLQWLIEDKDSDDSRFHTLYALSLAKSAIEAVEMDWNNEINGAKRFEQANMSDLESSRACGYPVRERLQSFLQASDLYDPEDVLDVIEGSELWLEKAVLYRKMGQETLVLEILALKLEDSEAAERYCREIGRNDAYLQLLDMYLDPQNGKEPMFNAAVRLLHNHGESLDPLQVLEAVLYRKMGQETLVLEILALKLEDSEAAERYCREIGRNDAYLQLLDMYLDPQNGKEPMFNAAVRLLHNHGESLDPLQVLEKLSPEMPLKLASDTILRMLRARNHHHHQGMIVRNLSQAINLDSQLARLEERSRNVQINDESICDSCHACLGTKLFAMYPDDSVVCYKCYRHLGESTSARGRNFKQDPIIKPGWLVTR